MDHEPPLGGISEDEQRREDPHRGGMHAIRGRMAPALTAGEGLPWMRGFATAMGVSPSTVVEIHHRLAAEGMIRARPGCGFYVSGRLRQGGPETAPGRELEGGAGRLI